MLHTLRTIGPVRTCCGNKFTLIPLKYLRLLGRGIIKLNVYMVADVLNPLKLN